jgi:LysM repeat protein
MSNVRQAGLGILTALFSSALVFGSMLLALVEGGKHVALAPTPTNTALIATPKPGEPTFNPSAPKPPTETPTAPESTCANRPPGWMSYEVLPGETLADIAQAFGTSAEALRQANCLDSNGLVAGSVLSVPPLAPTPTPTSTATPQTPTATEETKPTKAAQREVARCSGPPAYWVTYKVKKGDTIFRIATSYGLTSAELMSANCLTSNVIRVGQIIYVPNYPAKTPKRTPTPRPAAPPPVETLPPPVNTEPPPVETEPPPVVTEPPPPPPAETQPPPVKTEPPPPPPAETLPPAPSTTEAPVVTQAPVVITP